MNDPVIHAVIGAQFGDLEFDVGKSVRWTQWFADHVHVTDIATGDQRYWVVDWAHTFPNVEVDISRYNFFAAAVKFRKEQWRLYQTKFTVGPNDWVLWVDAHEGVSFDIKSLPNDYLASPFRSWVYREVTRAEVAGRDRVVVPFFLFVANKDLQNITLPGTGSPDEDVPDTQQSVSVPYYVGKQGLTRLMKVSVLNDVNFDWTTLDQVAPWENAPGTGIPQVDGYMSPMVPSANVITTPDPGPLPTEYTIVTEVVGPTVSTGTIVQQHSNSTTDRSWTLNRRSTDGGFTYATYPAGTSTPSSTRTNQVLPISAARDKIAASVTVDNGSGQGVLTTWKNVGGVWSVASTGTTTTPYTSWDSSLPIRIGNTTAAVNPFDGRIYSVEMRTGLDPAGGTVLWRFDANEVPAYVTAIDDTLDSDANVDGVADGWKVFDVGAAPANASRTVTTFQRIVASPTATAAGYGVESSAGFPCVPGDVITGRATVQFTTANATAAPANWYVRFYNSSDVYISASTSTNIVANASPTSVALTSFTAPANTAYGRIVLRTFSGTGANGTLQATLDVHSVKVFVNGITYTDPRGRVWTKTLADSVTTMIPAIRAVPTVKMQLISYGYAHWQNLDVDENGVVPPIDESNDYGYRMRQLISRVRPFTDFPYNATWNKDDSPLGLPGPWCTDIVRNTNPGLVVTEETAHTPSDPEMAGLMTPLYDTYFRLNLRDGVWYEDGASGNIPLVWDSAAGDWVTNYDPVAWAEEGVGAWVGTDPA